MFAKPINLVLVFVTAFNLLILAIPIIITILPYIEFEQGFRYIAIDTEIYERSKIAIFTLLFASCTLMLIYLMFDFIFGISARASIYNCKNFTKLKDYKFLSDVFKQVQEKFDRKDVKLLIKSSDEINAYAVGGLRKNYIVLTQGLINHYLAKSNNMQNFLMAIRSVLGHEMSHIINKDFLPTYLVITNQKITNFISNILYLIFNFISRALIRIPYAGRRSSKIADLIYSISYIFLTLFNRIIVYNVYEFLRRFISRAIEFRCDKQSALAFDGINMSLALSMLGKRGYFTLFSTHPSTNRRISKVSQIKSVDNIIKQGFINRISNFASLILLIAICIYFSHLAKIDLMIKHYIQSHDEIYTQIKGIWYFCKQIIEQII